MLRVGVIIFAILAVLLSGCQQAAQQAASKVVEQTTGVKVDTNNNSVTVKNDKGEEVNFSSSMPDELKNFPVAPGMKLDSAGSMSSGGDKLSAANWKGSGTIKDAIDFYTKTLPQQGWTQASSFASDDGGLWTFDKGDNEVMLTISKDGDGVAVSALLGNSKQTPTATSKSSSSNSSSSSSSSSGSTSSASSSSLKATPTPAGPVTVDVSVLPDELKALPLPSGFAVIKGSTSRSTSGGKFSSAGATLFGKTAFKDVADFYGTNLPGKGWEEDNMSIYEDGASLSYVSKKDSNLDLEITIEKTDAGTEITLDISQY